MIFARLRNRLGLTSREQRAVLWLCLLFAVGCVVRAFHLFGVNP